MERWVVCSECGATKRQQEFYESRWGVCQPCSMCCDQRVREAEAQAHPTTAQPLVPDYPR